MHALVFALGVLLVQQLERLPPWWLALLLLLGAICLWRRLSLVAALAIGSGYAALFAAWQLSVAFPPQLESIDLLAQGRIASLPERRKGGERFEFIIEELNSGQATQPFRGRVRLSWYQFDHAPLRLGDRWRLNIRLKQSRGLLNPHGFDYEQWLWQRDLGATGYVRESPDNAPLEAGSLWSVGPWRQRLRDALHASASEGSAALLVALILGDGSAFEQEQWRQFRATGTSHLVTISGLHIGLVAGLAYLLFHWLWRCSAQLCLFLAAPRAATLAALLAAVLYSALAGFSVPTQRACIMAAALLLPRLLGREVRPLRGLSLSLVAVLLFDPRAILSAGFLLSFSAVAAIFWVLASRRRESYLRGLWRIQWAILLILTPLTLYLFGNASWLAFPVNLLAVPWFSFLLTPLAFLLALLLVLMPAWGAGLVTLASPLFAHTMAALAWIAQPSGLFHTAAFSWPWLLLAIAGAVWCVAPLRLPARSLGLLLMVPLFLPQEEELPAGALELVMFDVGQGLAVMVRTAHHRLLYDSGDTSGSGFNSGEGVVLPYLRGRGLGQIDRTLNSHGPCRAGESWRWDGVEFRILHPPDDRWSGNDACCVLWVGKGTGSLLLTGDLEQAGEQALLQAHPELRSVEVIQVGHQGSRTSSSPAFVSAVAARLALISSGHRNRAGVPGPEVVERWRASGAQVLNTSESGAIQLYLDPLKGVARVRQERQERAVYWRR